MNKSRTTAGPLGMSRVRSLLAFRHQNPVARLISLLAAFAMATLMVGAGAVYTTGAYAAGVCDLPGGFEIDGDMVAQNCTPPGDDWSAHTISPTDVTSTSQGGTYSPSKSDTDDPSGWVSSGSTPSKGDFGVAYTFAKIVNGHYIVYVAWERDGTSGTGGYVIEVDNSAPNAPGGVPQPNRSNGGSTFYLSTVGGSAPTLTCDGLFASQAQYGPNLDCPPPSISGFYSAINGSPITDSFTNLSVDTNGFYEVALDITALTGVAPSCPGPTAASLYIRSLTGQVKNGNLKGYLAPLELKPDSTCVAPTITTQTQQNAQIDGLDVVAPNTPQHDVATVTGTAGHPAPTGSVAFSLCGPTSSPTDCTTGGVSGGSNNLVQHASNSTAQSDDVSPSDPGWYCWRAEFTPVPVDNTNPFLPATATDKTNECFKVAHATPSIATQSSADPTPGSAAAANSVGFTVLGDTATLSNVVPGASLTGQNVSFSLYGPLGSAPGANDCTAGVRVSGPVDAPLTKVDNTTWQAVAPTYTPTASDGPGYYTWVASYGGDAINDGDSGACGDANETQHLVGPLLNLTKGTPHSTITAGDDVVYDIDLANVGAGTASGVVVTDVLPILNSGGSWTLEATNGYGCSIADGTGGNAGHQVVTCTVGQLDPSSSTQIAEVTATTTAADCGDINNSAVLAADPDVTQTAGPVTVHVQCPGLHITKVADADSVDVGSPIGFMVTVSNTGAGTATGVDLSDLLPTGPGITWTIDSDPLKTHGPLTCSISSGTLHCTGSLDAGATQVVHITSPTEWTGSGESEVNSCLGGTDGTGVYDNTAQVHASNVLDSPTASDNEAVLCPDLDVTKVAEAAQVDAGDPIGFTITASNTGSGSATGVLVSDHVPGGLAWTIANASGPLTCGFDNAGVLNCTGTLAAGQSEVIDITAPTSFAQCGTYDNTATLTAGNAPGDVASASTKVLCPNLGFVKSADTGTVTAGAQIGFTISATNASGANVGTAHGVVIDDPLPGGSGIDWSIASGPANCSIQGAPSNETLHCTAVDLAPGISESVHVVSGTNTTSCKVYSNHAALTAGNAPGLTASADTQVSCPIVSPPAQQPHPHVLPNTGGPNQWVFATGLALLLAGGTLVLADQRRKRRS